MRPAHDYLARSVRAGLPRPRLRHRRPARVTGGVRRRRREQPRLESSSPRCGARSAWRQVAWSDATVPSRARSSAEQLRARDSCLSLRHTRRSSPCPVRRFTIGLRRADHWPGGMGRPSRRDGARWRSTARRVNAFPRRGRRFRTTSSARCWASFRAGFDALPSEASGTDPHHRGVTSGPDAEVDGAVPRRSVLPAERGHDRLAPAASARMISSTSPSASSRGSRPGTVEARFVTPDVRRSSRATTGPRTS
jgi:hypothetical protein